MKREIAKIFQRDILVVLINLGTGAIVARSLGPVALGVWSILMMVPAYAEALGRTKADVAAVFFIGQGIFDKHDILSSLNYIALLSSVIFLLIASCIIDDLYWYLFQTHDSTYRHHLIFVLAYVPIQLFYLNYCYYQIGTANYKVYNRMVVMCSILNSVLVIGLLTFTNLNVGGMLIALVVSTFTALLYGWYEVRREGECFGKFKFGISRSLLKYGFHFYLTGLLGQVNESGTRLLSTGFLLSSQIGFLAQSQNLMQLFTRLSGAVNTVLYPTIASEAKESNSVDMAALAFRSVLIVIPSFGILCLFLAHPIVLLMYGEPYSVVAELIYILLPGVVISAAGSVFTSYFNGRGVARKLVRFQFISVVFQVLLAWVLLQNSGMYGGAIAISLALIFNGMIITYAFCKNTGASLRDLFPKKSDLLYTIRRANTTDN